MDRSTQIAQIIEKRRPLADRIDRVQHNLQTLAASLQQLEDYRAALKNKAEDSNTIASLDQISLKSLQAKLQTELKELIKLKARFSRDTLNIGVVGRARQGKSRLLQSLTKLTSAEIPDGDRQHCTGVRSTIYHTPDIDPYGEVTFYTQISFLNEIIAPYYEELKLGTPPATLEEFTSQPLPGLTPALSGAEHRAKHEWLRKYRSKFTEYSSLLHQTSPQRITRSQIREYVAQDDLRGERVFFKYMAVREVKIFCPFLSQGVEQIALVDMPGLGDTGIGDESRLMNAVGRDVDAVLFVRMPSSKGDDWFDVDVRLYDIALNALAELPIDLWSFMVLNQTDASSKNSDNRPNCQDLKNTIADKHLKVVDCLIANCAKPDEAETVLDRVLTHLTEQITTLDRRYAESRQLKLLQLHRIIQQQLEQAKAVLGQHANSERLFKSTFKQFWDDLTTGLEGLLDEIRQSLGKDDPAFQATVIEVMRKCRTQSGLPTEPPVIRQGRDREGDYTVAYADYLHKLRTDLSAHFLLLDGQIQQSLDGIKVKIVRRLINPPINLKLVDLQSPQPLKSIAQQLDSRMSGSNLALGFQTLADFNVSFSGIIQRQLRDYLDELTADRQPLLESALLSKEKLLEIAQVLAPTLLQTFMGQLPNPTWIQVKDFVQEVAETITDPSREQYQALLSLKPISSSELNGQTVLNRLNGLHEQVVSACEQTLNGLLKEPNHIAYAMTAEFVDRVLRSGKQRPKDVQDEWEIFLSDDTLKAQIWPQFQQMGNRKQEQQTWRYHVEEATNANLEERYRFLE